MLFRSKSTVFYRALVGTATFLLMSSIILLGICKFIQQAAIGGAYIALNFAYWMVSLVPKKRLWDLSRYECEDLRRHGVEEIHQDPGVLDRETIVYTYIVVCDLCQRIRKVVRDEQCHAQNGGLKFVARASSEE